MVTQRGWARFLLLGAFAACGGDEPGAPPSPAGDADGGGGGSGGSAGAAAFVRPSLGWEVGSCEFTYEEDFVYDVGPDSASVAARSDLPPSVGAAFGGWRRASGEATARDALWRQRGPDAVAHPESPPATTRRLTDEDTAYADPPDDVVLPGYDNDLPLFERGTDWAAPERCYETPRGARLLTEGEAYELYRGIAERTTGVAIDTTPGVRTVVGLRGAYPGTFQWHGNLPNRYNDTLVLLWTEAGGARRVREFPAHTDTGAIDFGEDASSSLWPNRRYHHENGWHNTYNALRIAESGYRVRDDTNHNGHWDSDRNGWLPPPGADDHDRTGSAHNIHTGDVDGLLGEAPVDTASAGCQVIPGIANWIEFIAQAWTGLGDRVDYFLIDARDIPLEIWQPGAPDGTHRYPFLIEQLPFSHQGDTAAVDTRQLSAYSCAPSIDESGPEIVYALPLDAQGTLSVTVDCAAPVDVDVHLLMADNDDACLARDDSSLSYDLGPGRYFIVVDSYVAAGQELAGSYTLHVAFQ